jgi:PKD repeat protein
MVDATTGANLPMAANAVVRNGGADAAIVSLASDGTNVYGSGYTFGAGGTMEGTFAAAWDGGTMRWANDCHGDTYSVHPRGGALYAAGHSHHCGTIGGFPQTDPDWTFYRGLAFGTQATGVADQDFYGHTSYKGRPTSSLLAWYPTINAGTYTGMNQGPWSVSGNQDYVVMGGEFTRVNNKAQQGLVRFPASHLSPNAQGPTLFSTTYPLNVSSTEAGTVRINWSTNRDIDNDALTYRVYRDVQLGSGLVHVRRARARFWEPYTMGFTDTGLEPGSTHQYRVQVSDPFGNVANSPWTTVTVAASGNDSAYLEAVRASEPVDLWRLGDTGTTGPADAVGFTPLVTGTGVTRGATGAISGDSNRAMTFDGTSSGIAWSTKRISPPRELSLETWFRTSSTTGGKLIGFGNRQNTSSSTYDRHLYLDNSGRVVFGVNDGALQTVTSPLTYRNNAWHHVVATLSRTAGMKLYVDGALVAQKATAIAGRGGYWGWWRIGGDNLSSWPSRPTNNYFTGSLDEVAIYHRGLDAGEVQAHYAAATGANVPPTASFTSAVTGLDVAVDASASSDQDGSVASYAWSFGDGSTGTGATASHRYASAGTYTVTLTVTDDDGATGTTTRQVVVSASNVAPTASFTSTVTGTGVALDASASSDPDGSIASYAWDFGDGSTGTGATATHGYATGGTYTVRLTVTDDDGATGTTTRQVTIAAPAALAVDAFERLVTGGWGTADVGGAWTGSGTASNFNVAGGVGTIRMGAAGSGPSRALAGVSSASTEMRATVGVDKPATGGGIYLTVRPRVVASGDRYYVDTKLNAGGTVSVILGRNVGSTETVLQTRTVSGLTVVPTDRLQVKVQAVGTSPTTLRAKVWKVGTPEPTDWTASVSDTTASLQAAGSIGVGTYLSGSATNAPVVASFDDLWVGAAP